jgi:hypothetical protein
MATTWRKQLKKQLLKGAYHPRRRARLCLALEKLEDRTVPASLAALAYNDVAATPVVAKAFLTDLYKDSLFRAPDASELTPLSADLNSGKLTAGGAFADLVSSPEFKSLVSPVLTMYESFLGRPAELGGLSYWVQLGFRCRRSPRAWPNRLNSSPATATSLPSPTITL